MRLLNGRGGSTVRAWLLGVAVVLVGAGAVQAQDFRGRIVGEVRDTSGAILPGVTVTASSPALIQPQAASTGGRRHYRLIALPPGVYDLTFEMPGFQTSPEGVRVVINTTLSSSRSSRSPRCRKPSPSPARRPSWTRSTTRSAPTSPRSC